MDTAAKFIKTSSIYMAGSAASKLVALLLMPIYTAYLLPEQFGYFNLSANIVLVAVPFFSMEIWTGILRFMLDSRDRGNKPAYVNAGFYITIFSLTVISVIFICIKIFFNVELLIYIYIYCVMQSVQHIYESFARGFEKSGLFAASGLVNCFVAMGANVVMIVGAGFGIEALFLGTALGQLIQVVMIEAKIHAVKYLSRGYFDKAALGAMIKFSAPLSIGTVCYWFSTGYSAVVISRAAGLAENGMYTVAGRFVGVLLFFQQIFNLATQEILYKAQEDKGALYNSSMNYYFKFLSISTFAMITLVKAVYPLFVNEAYAQSLKYIPLYFLASFISYYAVYLGNYFLKENKTAENSLSLFVPAVINVALLHLLIEPLGAQSANVALLLAYTASAVMRLVQLRGFAGMRFDYKYLPKFVLLLAATFAVFYCLGNIYNFIWAIVLGVVLLWEFRGFIGPALAMVRGKQGK